MRKTNRGGETGLDWGLGEAAWLANIVAREALLFAAIGFIIGGIDDLAIDVLWVVRRVARRATVYRRHARASVTDFAQPAGRYAMLVPAWDEADVIAPMLRMTLTRLPCARLIVFVGCYANDRATIAEVAGVAAGDARVVLVVNPLPGPTTKADNLNALWRAVERHECARGETFDAIVVHDAEDVVALDELRAFEHLLKRADVVQLPVLPLVDMRSRWVSGHYLDEFAESHAKALVVREALGAALPLAGTGFAMRRELIARLAAERAGAPFDADSFVEDYEMGLALARLGARAMLARVPARPGGPPIAVRAHFPATLDAAVRQKARWMTGIALAGWDRTGWSHWRRRGLRENWMRLRDRRAPLSVLVLALAYLGLIAWIVTAAIVFVDGAPAPLLDLPGWLLVTSGMLMGWRLALRAVFVARAYGWREGLRSIPRMVVANAIALLAARRAIGCYVTLLRGRGVAWDKTRHTFPATLPAE